jgi:hypothetical protein
VVLRSIGWYKDRNDTEEAPKRTQQLSKQVQSNIEARRYWSQKPNYKIQPPNEYRQKQMLPLTHAKICA